MARKAKTANADDLRAARTDKKLFKLLQANLRHLFPVKLREDNAIFLSELRSAPRGLRAMAATYDLDVSMSLDDLAWHFTNHPEFEFAGETLLGLRELEANEAADIFESAMSIIEPHLLELKEFLAAEESGDHHTWLIARGIQAQMDPLNRRMWALIKQLPGHSLFHYWHIYARKFPEHCAVP